MAVKTKHKILDQDGTVDYIIVKKEYDKYKIKYTMKSSKEDHWMSDCRGEKLYSIIDNDGDCQIISHGYNYGDLPYHALAELRTLLNFIVKE